jgi:hypothetical protein
VLSAYLHDRITTHVTKQNKEAIGNVRCSGQGDSDSCAPALKSELWTALYFPFHGDAKFGQAVVTLVHRLLLQHPDNKDLHRIAADFQRNARTLETWMSLLLSLVRRMALT